MPNIKKPQTVWKQLEADRQHRIKEIKRKKFRLKAKLVLTVILPAFAGLLSVKVVQTFVRIKVREVFTTAAAEKETKKVSAAMVPLKKETVIPIPVKVEKL